MKEEIRELADVAIVFRNHNTCEFGPNEYWDNELQEKLNAVGVQTELIDNDERMVIIDT